MNDKNIRMVQGWEVLNSFRVGKYEVLFGFDIKATHEIFLVTYAHTNNPFNVEEYVEAIVTDDYLEAMTEFTKRTSEQVKLMCDERSKINIKEVIDKDSCLSISNMDTIENKVVVVRADLLRHEHRTADKQIFIATSGNGCRLNALGTAVFATNLYSGEEERWRRTDFLGVIKPEKMPDWATQKLEKYRKNHPVSKITVNKNIDSDDRDR